MSMRVERSTADQVLCCGDSVLYCMGSHRLVKTTPTLQVRNRFDDLKQKKYQQEPLDTVADGEAPCWLASVPCPPDETLNATFNVRAGFDRRVLEQQEVEEKERELRRERKRERRVSACPMMLA